MFIQQTTESSRFVQFATVALPAQECAARVSSYLTRRANILGLPQVQMDAKGQRQNVTAFNLKLAARLTALGSAFGPMMAMNAQDKAFIETLMNGIIANQIGGLDKIEATGEWSWVLTKDQTGALVFFPDGKTFTLPGVPFNVVVGGGGPMGQQGSPATTYIINIAVDPNTGIGTATATVDGQPAPLPL
jgi:hypothetical protein